MARPIRQSLLLFCTALHTADISLVFLVLGTKPRALHVLFPYYAQVLGTFCYSGKTFGFCPWENFRLLGIAESRIFSHKLVSVARGFLAPQSHPDSSEGSQTFMARETQQQLRALGALARFDSHHPHHAHGGSQPPVPAFPSIQWPSVELCASEAPTHIK